jgi:hypothetical protein
MLRAALESGDKLTKQFRWELEYYFGSVLNAKLELQTDTRILNGWSPKRVILEIHRRHRLRLSLLYIMVRGRVSCIRECGREIFRYLGASALRGRT